MIAPSISYPSDANPVNSVKNEESEWTSRSVKK
jgi:hypothetical protein